MAQAKHLALVSPKSAPSFVGAVLPFKPQIDKVAALVFLVDSNKIDVSHVTYWKRDDCPPEQFAAWRDKGWHPIDIGDRKYHRAGVPSATEFVAKEFGIPLTSGRAKILELINENNKTGFLKGMPFSVAHLMREFYELDEWNEDFHLEIITRAADVIQAFMVVENGEGLGRSADDYASHDALDDIVRQFKVCNYQPFTLGRYARDLFTIGVDYEEIVGRIEFWTTNRNRVREAQKKGQELFQNLNPLDTFFVGSRNKKKGIVLRTDNRYIVRAAMKSEEYPIRIVVDSNGNTVISTTRISLAALAEELKSREPGLWYYQKETCALMNGGPQYKGMQPTKLRPSRLIALLQEFVAA